MTFRPTPKQQQLLAAVNAGAGRHGIYALARHLRRPYRRVYDQVKLLADAGLLQTQIRQTNGRACMAVLPTKARNSQPLPALQFNRSWSRPDIALPTKNVIAQVLARPTFRDLLSCTLSVGLTAVRQQLNAMIAAFELPAAVAAENTRMLRNIELGLSRAAR